MNSKKQRSNILFITSDQQHWCTLGILNKEIKTPNLDRLAKEGMLFQRAYTVNPTCTPTRASLITGQYPSQHGAWSLGTKLPETAHTIGDDFPGLVLENDPEEVNNLWDDPKYEKLKSELITKLLFAEMGKEPLWMPRV